MLIARKNTIFVLSGASEEFLNGFSSTGREVSPMVQCWPKETLRAMFYEAKILTQDGYSKI